MVNETTSNPNSKLPLKTKNIGLNQGVY